VEKLAEAVRERANLVRESEARLRSRLAELRGELDREIDRLGGATLALAPDPPSQQPGAEVAFMPLPRQSESPMPSPSVRSASSP
jgi:hypothetical protein